MMRTAPYSQKKISDQEWENYSDKKGFLEQNFTIKSHDNLTFKVTKFVRNHADDTQWKIAQVLKALFFTVITLGIICFWKRGCNLWLKAYFAQEIISVKQIMNAVDARVDEIGTHKLSEKSSAQLSKVALENPQETVLSEPIQPPIIETSDTENEAPTPKKIILAQENPGETECETDIPKEIPAEINVDLESSLPAEESKNLNGDFPTDLESTLESPFVDPSSIEYFFNAFSSLAENPPETANGAEFLEALGQLARSVLLHADFDKKMQEESIRNSFFYFFEENSLYFELGSEEASMRLVDIMMQYATDEQFLKFLQYINTSIKLEVNDSLLFCLMDKMTPQCWERLFKISKVEIFELMLSMASFEFSSSYYPWISSLYLAFPQHPVWNHQALDDESFNPHAFVIILMGLYNSLKENPENLNAIHTHIENAWKEKVMNMDHILAILLEEESANKTQIIEPFLKSYVLHKHEKAVDCQWALNLCQNLRTKRQSLAYLRACNSLKEPFRSAYLGLIQGSPRDELRASAKNLFKACKLNKDDFPAINEITINQMYLHKKMLEAFSQMSIEELESTLREPCSRNQIRALSAGIKIDGFIVKNQISEENIAALFDKIGKYKYSDFFKKPVSLEELFNENNKAKK